LRVKIGFNWLLIPFNPQQQWFMAVFPGRFCSCFYTSSDPADWVAPEHD
jgi:hypothetical protein